MATYRANSRPRTRKIVGGMALLTGLVGIGHCISEPNPDQSGDAQMPLTFPTRPAPPAPFTMGINMALPGIVGAIVTHAPWEPPGIVVTTTNEGPGTPPSVITRMLEKNPNAFLECIHTVSGPSFQVMSGPRPELRINDLNAMLSITLTQGQDAYLVGLGESMTSQLT